MAWFLIKLELYEEWEIKLALQGNNTVGQTLAYCLPIYVVFNEALLFEKYFYNFRYLISDVCKL